MPLSISQHRATTYLATGLGLTLCYALLRGSDWQGGATLHTVMEAMATLLAFVVGALALVRYYSKKDSIFLFIGVGFLGTGFLDGYHAVVTSAYFRPYMPSDLPALIPWSWVASRQFLSILMSVSWFAWWQEDRLGKAGKFKERSVYIFSGLFTIVSFLFFAFFPLPPAYYPDSIFHRPEEFAPALFFLIALIGYLKKGRWRDDVFEHWLVLSLIVGFVSQAVFMSFSGALFDLEFDAAHTLKKVSYLCVLTGLLLSMYTIFRREEGLVRELDFQKLSLDEHAIVSITDVEGNISYVNDKFCDISGYSRDELIGKNHSMFKSEEHAPEFYADLWRTITDGKTWHGEIKNATKDGRAYWVKISIVPFLNQQGTPFQYVAIRTDITAQRNSERELYDKANELKTMLSSTSQGYWRIDNNARTIEMNPRMADILGVSPSEAVGTLVNDYLTQEQMAFHRDKLQNRTVGKSETYELMLMSKTGNEVPCIFSATPLYDATGQKNGSFALVSDITERVSAEEAVHKAMEEAEKANFAKSEFLSSMSHELRTPMNAILGFGQMLKFNPKEPLTEKQTDFVEQIMKGGQHLLELINEVLDLAKIEAGRIDLSIEGICVKTTLDECLTLIQSMADKRGIEITVGEGFEKTEDIRADLTRLKQTLLNLLSNAVKYNRENGKIMIDCHRTPTSMIRITVSDTGAGIPEDMLEALFEPFNRLSAESSEIEGTGIGLTITKQLVERMHGHIGVESEVGKGSTFWVEFPMVERKLTDVAASTEKALADGSHRLPDASGTVLYVEDNPANTRLMESIIEMVSGLSLITAHNAELGIELAQSTPPDLIIMDINLPGMDGYGALEKLQSLTQTKNIPVIALSANATPKDIEKGINAGFLKYLTKPIKVDELVNAVKDVLEG